MKQCLLLITLAFSGFSNASAQTYPLFTTSETIDVGNVRAAHLVHGDMWWDPATQTSRCEYPKGSGKHVATANGLWMGGFDAGGNLRVAAQTYRQKGNDYWPGPIDTGTLKPVSYATSLAWAKIWKVERAQIDSFNALAAHTAANTPTSILEWPAKGNPYTKGAGGVTLSINQPMAPFVDVNSDGLYNPLAGDYPAMKGDQMLWWVVNDTGAKVHTASATNALGVDVKMMAYAYHNNPVLDNIIFYEFLITNHTATAYSAFRVGMGTDFELGDASDDYAGFDSSRRMEYVYNSSNVDVLYGMHPPLAGIAVMEAPGDNANTHRPAGSFMTYQNSGGSNGDPAKGSEFYRLMNAMNRVGTPLPNNSRYQYLQDTMCSLNMTPGDVRMTIALDSFMLAAGATVKIAMALVIAPGGGCPVHSLDSIRLTADSAFKYYWNPPHQTATAVTSTPKTNSFRLYPNPANSILFIETVTATSNPLTMLIYDALGRAYQPPATQNGNKTELNISALPPGIYTIRLQDASGVSAAVFVKE